MAETSAPAVVDYLARLDDAARRLPSELRAELVGQVREHLADLEASGLDDAGLRTALDRFGTPEALVAADAEQAGLALTPAATTTKVWGGLEITAVLLLLVGVFVVPVVAPLTGLVLAWLSPRWTRRTKVGATLLLGAPVLWLGLTVLGVDLRLPVNTTLVAVTVAGWLGAGLLLALSGRRPRPATNDDREGRVR